MSIKSSLIKNTGFNLAGYFYLLLASFFSISILLHNLGRDVFGVYVFLASFISLAAVFDFGISTAVVRKLSIPQTTRDEKVKTWKTSFSIFLILAGILFLTVIVLLQYLSKTMGIFSHIDGSTLNFSILILAVIIFINHVNTHLLSLPQAEQRFDIFNVKTFFVGTANTVVSAIVSGFYHNIALLFLFQLVFHLLTFIFMIVYSLKFFSGKDFAPRYDRRTGKDLFSFGIKNFVGTLMGQVESQLSGFVLGAMATASAITSFSIPQSIVVKGAGVVSQFAQAFFPLSASLLEKDRIKKLKSLVLGIEAITLAGGILAVFLSFSIGDQFLTWWLKDPVVVQTAFPVLKILSFYFVLVSLTPVPTALLQGLNKPQIPSFFATLTVTFEIILSILLVPGMGPVGMAYAFLASVCVTVPLMLGASWKNLQMEIKRTQSLDEIPPQISPVSTI
ncbi:MAG TPA: oligosaccharide flippase family protein [Patescibacteria group bacterium]